MTSCNFASLKSDFTFTFSPFSEGIFKVKMGQMVSALMDSKVDFV